MKLRTGSRSRIAAFSLAGAVLIGSLVGAPAFANASELLPEYSAAGVPDISTLAQLEAELDARGVSAAAKVTILEAARTGTPLLADDPTAAPVRTEKVQRSGFTVTVKTFADGSFSEEGTEVAVKAPAPGTITPMSVDGCTASSVTGGTKYTGCKVYYWQGSIAMSFFVTYTILTSGNDKINSVWGENTSAPFYGQSNASLSISRATESASGPALARYYVGLTGTISGVPVNTSRTLSLNVGGNAAWETFGF